MAEDDLDILRLLSDTLMLHGYRVVPARNGDLAWQVCRRLRADPETQKIGVITLTADRRRRDDALRAGADAFLVKPFAPRELRQQVEAVEQQWHAAKGRE